MDGPTIYDVARRAGVSKSTVSKVLNKTPYVSQSTRERVEAAIADLNYHPNIAARRFQSRRSRLIGLVFPSLGTGELATLPSFFSAMLGGAATVAGRQGYDLVWPVSAIDRDQPDDYARAYLRREVDGLVLTNVRPHDPRVAALQRAGCPFVIVGRYDHPDVYTVDVDNVAIGYLAARHLVQQGHTRIALLNGPREFLHCQDRYTGYTQALTKGNIPVDPSYVTWDALSEAYGYEATRCLLSREAPPTAFIATDPGLYVGVLHALHEAGLSVPRHCSVVVVDSVRPSDFAPIVTTVVQPVADLAGTATQVLLRLIDEEQPSPQRRVLPPLLVAGATTMHPGQEVLRQKPDPTGSWQDTAPNHF